MSDCTPLINSLTWLHSAPGACSWQCSARPTPPPPRLPPGQRRSLRGCNLLSLQLFHDCYLVARFYWLCRETRGSSRAHGHPLCRRRRSMPSLHMPRASTGHDTRDGSTRDAHLSIAGPYQLHLTASQPASQPPCLSAAVAANASGPVGRHELAA